MADKATSSYGSIIYSAADAESLPGSITTLVGQIIECSFDGLTVKTINATHLNQTGRAMRAKPGMYDPGSFKVKIHFDGDDYDDLHGWATGASTGATRWWLVKIPTADSVSNFHTASFRGIIENLSAAVPAEGDGVTADLSLKITGAVTWTPYAA